MNGAELEPTIEEYSWFSKTITYTWSKLGPLPPPFEEPVDVGAGVGEADPVGLGVELPEGLAVGLGEPLAVDPGEGVADESEETIESVVVARSVPELVLAEILPVPRFAFDGMVNALLNDPELEALNGSMTPPL